MLALGKNDGFAVGQAKADAAPAQPGTHVDLGPRAPHVIDRLVTDERFEHAPPAAAELPAAGSAVQRRCVGGRELHGEWGTAWIGPYDG